MVKLVSEAQSKLLSSKAASGLNSSTTPGGLKTRKQKLHEQQVAEYNRQLDAYETSKSEYEQKIAELKAKYGTGYDYTTNYKPIIDRTEKSELKEDKSYYYDLVRAYTQAVKDYAEEKVTYDNYINKISDGKEIMNSITYNNSSTSKSLKSLYDTIYNNLNGRIGNQLEGQLIRASTKLKEAEKEVNNNTSKYTQTDINNLSYLRAYYNVKSYNERLNNFIKDAKLSISDNDNFIAKKAVYYGHDLNYLQDKLTKYTTKYTQAKSVLSDAEVYESKRDVKNAAKEALEKQAQTLSNKYATISTYGGKTVVSQTNNPDGSITVKLADGTTKKVSSETNVKLGGSIADTSSMTAKQKEALVESSQKAELEKLNTQLGTSFTLSDKNLTKDINTAIKEYNKKIEATKIQQAQEIAKSAAPDLQKSISELTTDGITSEEADVILSKYNDYAKETNISLINEFNKKYGTNFSISDKNVFDKMREYENKKINEIIKGYSGSTLKYGEVINLARSGITFEDYRKSLGDTSSGLAIVLSEDVMKNYRSYFNVDNKSISGFPNGYAIQISANKFIEPEVKKQNIFEKSISNIVSSSPLLFTANLGYKGITESGIIKALEDDAKSAKKNISEILEESYNTRFLDVDAPIMKYKTSIEQKSIPIISQNTIKEDWYTKNIKQYIELKKPMEYSPLYTTALFAAGVGKFGYDILSTGKQIITKPFSTGVQIATHPIESTFGWIPESAKNIVSGDPYKSGQGFAGGVLLATSIAGGAGFKPKFIETSKLKVKTKFSNIFDNIQKKADVKVVKSEGKLVKVPIEGTKNAYEYFFSDELDKKVTGLEMSIEEKKAIKSMFKKGSGLETKDIKSIYEYGKTERLATELNKEFPLFSVDNSFFSGSYPTTKALARKEYKLIPEILEERIKKIDLEATKIEMKSPEYKKLLKDIETSKLPENVYLRENFGLFKSDIKSILEQPTEKALFRKESKLKETITDIEKRINEKEKLLATEKEKKRIKNLVDKEIDKMMDKYRKDIDISMGKDYDKTLKDNLLDQARSELNTKEYRENLTNRIIQDELDAVRYGKEIKFNKSILEQPTEKALLRKEIQFGKDITEFGKDKLKRVLKKEEKGGKFEAEKLYEEVEIFNKDGTVSIMLQEIKQKPVEKLKLKTIEEAIQESKLKQKPVEKLKTTEVKELTSNITKEIKPDKIKVESVFKERSKGKVFPILILKEPQSTAKTTQSIFTKTISLTKPKTITKTKPLEITETKEITLIKPIELEKLKEITLTKPIELEKSKTVTLTKTVELEKIKEVSITKPIEIEDVINKEKEKLKEEEKQIKKEKLKIFTTPQEKEEIKKGGYNVFVREKGKFIKANEKPLKYDDADKLGRIITDNTEAVSYKVNKSGRKGSNSKIANKYFAPPKSNYNTEKKNKNIFVEKETFRINTPGEIRGITVKGWLSQNKEPKISPPRKIQSRNIGFKTIKPTKRKTNVSEAGIAKRVMASKAKLRKNNVNKILNNYGLFSKNIKL